MRINWAINEIRSGDKINLNDLTRVYQSLPFPLFSETGLLAFWNVLSSTLLEIALGCFTKGPPLLKRLNRLSLDWQDNDKLDKLYKRMSNREER